MQDRIDRKCTKRKSNVTKNYQKIELLLQNYVFFDLRLLLVQKLKVNDTIQYERQHNIIFSLHHLL